MSCNGGTGHISTEDQPFCGATILLDGWFYIDVSESAGIEFEFPEPAFQSGLKVPAVFINSQSFSGMSKVYQATTKLAKTSCNGEMQMFFQERDTRIFAMSFSGYPDSS
jgi:hypothetical protein